MRIEDEMVWLSQKLVSKLFDVDVNTINYLIKEVYKSGEQDEKSTIRNFQIVQTSVALIKRPVHPLKNSSPA